MDKERKRDREPHDGSMHPAHSLVILTIIAGVEALDPHLLIEHCNELLGSHVNRMRGPALTRGILLVIAVLAIVKCLEVLCGCVAAHTIIGAGR